MTNPLVLAATYHKMSVPSSADELPSFLTRELGTIERGIKFATSYVGTVFNVLDFNADPRGARDATTALQSVLNTVASGDAIYLPPNVHFTISDALTCRTANVTVFGAGRSSLIEQITADTPAFSATSLANLTFRDFTVYGPGIWSSGWTGNEGHDERGIYATHCTGLRIERVWARNFGHSGIALRGTCSGTILDCAVEGTNLLGTALPASSNFQNGVYITYGPSNEGWGDIRILSPDVSECGQGILIERGTAAPTGAVLIATPYLHDIPGQHGVYCQAGKVTVTGGLCEDIELDAVKVQTGTSATATIESVVISGVNAIDCRGNAFEVAGLDDTYAIRNVTIDGCSARGCDRILSIVGLVDGVTATVRGGDTEGHGVYIADSSALVPKNVTVTVDADTIDRHGVYVSSDGATNIRVFPNLTDVGQETSNTWDGVNVEGDTTGVSIHNPRLVNATGSMRYGIFQSDAVGRTKVYGSAEISGVGTDEVRGVGQLAWGPVEMVRASSATTTAEYSDGTLLIDATGGARTVNLLPAAYVVDRVYTVKKVDAGVNAVTVDPSGAETIDGAATYALALQWASVTIRCDGTAWFIE